MKRGQFTVEFMLLFAIAFFLFLVLLTFITQYVTDSTEQAELKRLNSIAESLKKDVVLAYESGTGFEARLNIPNSIDGTQINITIDEAVDVLFVRSTLSNQTVMKNLPKVSGTFTTGCNTIRKENEEVKIATC